MSHHSGSLLLLVDLTFTTPQRGQLPRSDKNANAASTEQEMRTVLVTERAVRWWGMKCSFHSVSTAQPFEWKHHPSRKRYNTKFAVSPARHSALRTRPPRPGA